VRTLFVSGYTVETVRGRGRLPTDSAFLEKPFDRVSLLRASPAGCSGGGQYFMEVQVSGRGKTPQQGVTLSRSVLRIAGDGHVEAAAAPWWGLMNNWGRSHNRCRLSNDAASRSQRSGRMAILPAHDDRAESHEHDTWYGSMLVEIDPHHTSKTC
jgi:hypothetical protein